jgi:O-antigen/teichoic acid export membrane protein
MGLIRLSFLLSIAIAILVTAILMTSGDWVMTTLGIEDIASFLLLIPVAMIFSALMQIGQQWLIRKKEFSIIGRTTILHSLVLNSAKGGLGLLHPVGATLIILAALGNALYASMLFYGAIRSLKKKPQIFLGAAETKFKELAYQYRDFPLYRAPQNFISACSQSLPVLMLASFFGPATAGFYVLARTVIALPTNLIGKAIHDVSYPLFLQKHRNGECISRHILKATGALIAVGILPFGIVMIFGPWLFGFVFGDNWMTAGEYAKLMAPFFLFNLINKPFVAAVPVLGIQRGLLIYEIFSTGSKVLGLALGFYWFNSDLWAVGIFSAIGVVSYGAMMVWILLHAMRWGSDGETS